MSALPVLALHRRWGLVTVLYAHRALTGLVLALPAVATLGTVSAHYPRAQAELFDAGGVMLLESLRVAGRSLPALGWSSALVAVVAWVLGLAPLVWLVAGLGQAGPTGRVFYASVLAARGVTVLVLSAVGALVQALAGALSLLLLSKLVGAFRLSVPADDWAMLGAVLTALVVTAVLGLLRDVACVAAVDGREGLRAALASAGRAMVHAPGRLVLGWALRTGLGLGVVAAGAWGALQLPGAFGGWLLLSVLLHQGALFGAVWARAAWLRQALVAVREAERARAQLTA